MQIGISISWRVGAVVIVLASACAVSAQERPSQQKDDEQAQADRGDMRANLLECLPEDVDVVVSLPAAFFQTDAKSEATATPVSRLAHFVAAHAIGSLFRDADDAAAAKTRPAKSTVEDVERMMIALWPRKAAAELVADERDADHDPTGGRKWWEGVLLLEMKGKDAAATLLRDCGFVRALEGHPDVFVPDVKEGESPHAYAGVLSERAVVAAPSVACVEKLLAAGRAVKPPKRTNAWKAYWPEGRAPEFWAARRFGARTSPGEPYLETGFAAASTADNATVKLTWVFGENKVPRSFAAGVPIEEALYPLLEIQDYGAIFTITEVTKSKMICKVQLEEGEGRGGAAVLVTIQQNLLISAFRPGDKSP